VAVVYRQLEGVTTGYGAVAIGRHQLEIIRHANIYYTRTGIKTGTRVPVSVVALRCFMELFILFIYPHSETITQLHDTISQEKHNLKITDKTTVMLLISQQSQYYTLISGLSKMFDVVNMTTCSRRMIECLLKIGL